MNSNLSFAKIVATPTDIAWSQVYNAGSLFIIVSLTTDTPSDEVPLNTLGKQVINNLEAEFFTLETKDLPSIKSAVTTSLQETPDSVIVSLVLAYVKDSVLYLLTAGPGKTIMKRGDALGVLLESKNQQRESVTASGYINNDDTVILQTAQFAGLVPQEALHKALELSHPSDIAETLTPTLHSSENGAASAIVIHFKGVTAHTPIVKTEDTTVAHSEDPQPHHHAPAPHQTHEGKKNEEEVETEEIESEDTETEATKPRHSWTASRLQIKKPNFRFNRKFRNILFISLAVVIAVILIASVFKTIQQQQQAKDTAAFRQIYQAAQKDYEDGISLQTLNPGFARDDFLAAKEKLEKGIPQFPENSDEKKQLAELLQKVNSELGSGGTTNTVTPTAADADDSPALAALLKDADNLFAAPSDDSLYTLTKENILQDNKSIIDNDDSWMQPAGFATYLSNIYVLDKKAGVLKFVAAESGYGQTNYFSDSQPDLSQASGMTIDGSVWLLFSDSRIMKYTKGQSENFTIKGLEQLFSKPAAIATTVDGNALYVLDPGNSRIVIINKDGNYQKSLVAAELAKTRAIDVNEEANSLYFLSGDKIFKLDLN